MTLPGGLQNLTFGNGFDQDMNQVTLPRTLQHLAFGRSGLPIKGLTFPDELKSLTFVNFSPKQIRDKVTLPGSLRSFTLGDRFNQSLDPVTLPSSLESLILGRDFNQSLQGLTLPKSLQSLTFGENFDQSLDKVTWPSGLQTLKFNDKFLQSFERMNCALPNSLRTVQCGSVVISSL